MQSGNPPIVELVVGVQFSTERPVDSTKLVLFWNESVRGEFPNASEAPPVEDTFEKFDETVSWQRPGLRLSLESLPRIRYQFTTPARDRMVQLQATRLVLNWMRRDSAYPRFSTIHREFAAMFRAWQDFAHNNGVGEVVPNQWELCYVNLIPQGGLWATPSDWHRVSTLLVAGVEAFEPLALEDRSFQWRLRMPKNAGRITLTVSQVKSDDGRPGMHLILTASGPAATIEESHERLQAAHDQILELFGRLATNEAKAYWGMQTL